MKKYNYLVMHTCPVCLSPFNFCCDYDGTVLPFLHSQRLYNLTISTTEREEGKSPSQTNSGLSSHRGEKTR